MYPIGFSFTTSGLCMAQVWWRSKSPPDILFPIWDCIVYIYVILSFYSLLDALSSNNFICSSSTTWMLCKLYAPTGGVYDFMGFIFSSCGKLDFRFLILLDKRDSVRLIWSSNFLQLSNSNLLAIKSSFLTHGNLYDSPNVNAPENAKPWGVVPVVLWFIYNKFLFIDLLKYVIFREFKNYWANSA